MLIRILVVLFLAMLGFLCVRLLPASVTENGQGETLSLIFAICLIAAAMISALRTR